MTLTVRDATFSGDVTRSLDLDFAAERVTVREIIAARVRQEVGAYNAERAGEAFDGLVQPATPGAREVDAERQVYVALDAFQKNGFFVLVDDLQAESLEQLVRLRPGTEVSFVKLTPLVGG